jgi:hypothetical protein
VHRYSLTSTEYEEILTLIGRDTSIEQYDEIACDWLKKHEEIWSNWVPSDDSERTKIYIGGIFPMGGTVYQAKGITAGKINHQS